MEDDQSPARLGLGAVALNRIAEAASPDAETAVNEVGAKQSKLDYAFTHFDGPAMFEMAAVLHEGAEKYGRDNWRGIPVDDHLNHLLMHVFAYLHGDRTDGHLSHIMCRAMFAQAVELQGEGTRVVFRDCKINPSI